LSGRWTDADARAACPIQTSRTFVGIHGCSTLFVRYRLVPFASGYVPSGELMSRRVGLVAAVLFGSFALAWIEHFVLTSKAGYLTLIAIMVGLTAAAMAVDGASPRLVAPLDLDEPRRFPPSDWIWRDDGVAS
jgi:hypothetical protein